MHPSPLARDALTNIFRSAEKPPADFRIGAEEEKFGVHEQSGKPLGYLEDFGVCRVMGQLAEEHGWRAVREGEEGPVIALKRGLASVTLEPGAQLELSGAPLGDLHALCDEQSEHRAELAGISKELGIAWLSTGFQPLARLEELPWVPKQRYPVMREYLPTRGSGAHDMMQRTATVQVNFDWSSERDLLRKAVVALKLTPIVHALFANAPFKEGRPAGKLSERGDVWLRMDPARSGLIEPLWASRPLGYDDYVEWALDAGMFLFWRGSLPIKNTGQTFRAFMRDGFHGYQATEEDWRLHLTTLFPEVRLKSTLEIRPCDALPPALSLAALALWTGLLYDERALTSAEELCADWEFQPVSDARPGLVREGLDAPFLGAKNGWQLAERLVELAADGLVQRGRAGAGQASESKYLLPAVRLVEARTSPAAQALERAQRTGSLIEATRNDRDDPPQA